jgi:alpha-galactosidase
VTDQNKQDLGHYEHSKVAENLGIHDRVRRPIKVVFLGAGSGFFEKLFVDVLSIPGADAGEMALVDVDPERLELAHRLGEKIVQTTGAGWTVAATADRRAVLEGADYIVNCIEVSGVDCVRFDNDIPAKYGVDQCIGDTIGPGGLFKALRTVPVFLDVLDDVEDLCPDAWVLNYTNPMSILCLSAAMASDAKVVGLCHSVQGTSHGLARHAGVPYAELKWRCGGVNHLAWFTELTHRGEDLYPILFEKSRSDPETYEADPVRWDMMHHFGYFVTESSGHFSEYLPYYRKRPELVRKYCRDRYRGGSGFYAREWPGWRAGCDRNRREILEGKRPLEIERTWEYCSWIIQAMETHRPFVIHGTVPNTGLIDNLPVDGVVEVACVVDARGVTPTYFGPLPPQCAAICDWNMRMYELAAIACVARSREAAAHALMLDPLTAAVCCPAEIKQMTDELFEAEKDFLPGF